VAEIVGALDNINKKRAAIKDIGIKLKEGGGIGGMVEH
jgi:hypothetical protein